MNAQVPLASFHKLAENVKTAASAPFALQVGAMDGVYYDLLNPHLLRGGWSGLLVEPMPDMFAALQKTYEGQLQLRLVNCAIADHDGTLTMRRIDPAAIAAGRVPAETLGMSTAHTLGGNADFEKTHAAHLIEVAVPCRTLPGVLEEYGVKAIDLVMIDVEGADFEVARQIDLTRFAPRLICIEYAHLKLQDMRECCTHFMKFGYAAALCEEDQQNLLFYK
jgi:FkbM family methyltransferase